MSVGLDGKVAAAAGVGGLIGFWLDTAVRRRGHVSLRRPAVGPNQGSSLTRQFTDRSGGADHAPCECPEVFHELGVHRPGYEPPTGTRPNRAQ